MVAKQNPGVRRSTPWPRAGFLARIGESSDVLRGQANVCSYGWARRS